MNKIALASLDRPKDSIVYTAGDVIGFSSSNRSQTSCIIPFNFSGPVERLGTVIITVGPAQPVMPVLELWLFVQRPGDVADNFPWAPSQRDLLHLAKIVTFNSFPGKGIHVLQSRTDEFPIRYTRGVYGVLVVRNAYKPQPGEQYLISLVGNEDLLVTTTPVGNVSPVMDPPV